MSTKYERQKLYDSNNVEHFSLKLNINTDGALIDWLQQQENKQQAIKRALQNEIQREQSLKKRTKNL